MLIWAYTCENATMLEITCHGSNINSVCIDEAICLMLLLIVICLLLTLAMIWAIAHWWSWNILKNIVSLEFQYRSGSSDWFNKAWVAMNQPIDMYIKAKTQVSLSIHLVGSVFAVCLKIYRRSLVKDSDQSLSRLPGWFESSPWSHATRLCFRPSFRHTLFLPQQWTVHSGVSKC